MLQFNVKGLMNSLRSLFLPNRKSISKFYLTYADRIPLTPKKEKIFSFLRDRKIKIKKKESKN